MDGVLFLILAGGKGERLAPLTDQCPKPLVHFGISNKIIDFTLYNCLSASGSEIVLLTQQFSEMIEQYIQENWRRVFGAKGINLTVARGHDSVKGRFSGTADAVFQSLSTRASLPEVVVVLSADHIYRMDYRPMVRFHREHGKTATVSAVPCDRDQAYRFGIVNHEIDGTIRSFHEKPNNLDGVLPHTSTPLASMGIYVFSTGPLMRFLEDNQSCPSNDFGKDVLPEMVKSRDAKVFPFVRSDGQKKYWRDVGDLSAYKQATDEYFGGQHEPLHFSSLPGWKQRQISHSGTPGKATDRRFSLYPNLQPVQMFAENAEMKRHNNRDGE